MHTKVTGLDVDMGWNSLDDVDVANKIVLIRVDINVPMDAGKVTDATRMVRIVPTIKDVMAKGGRPVLLAHFGRPKSKVAPEFSLAPLASELSTHLGVPVVFGSDCIGEAAKLAISDQKVGSVVLLENTRFHPGEEKNDPDFAAALAELGDVYVNDAFSAAHRMHGSTAGIARLLPSCAGRLMQAELSALEVALSEPKRPVAAVVGGAKVSTKLELLGNLTRKVDYLIIGGGMANTFLAAQGVEVGTSLCEYDLADTARDILKSAGESGCEIILPVDVVVAREFAANAANEVCLAAKCPPDQMILDAGPRSVAKIREIFQSSRTLIWNGPLGAFEIDPFDRATNAAAQSAAELTNAGTLISVAGGGDTVAALSQAGVAEQFSYISTAGGAFLEWMEGKTLPGVAALET